MVTSTAYKTIKSVRSGVDFTVTRRLDSTGVSLGSGLSSSNSAGGGGGGFFRIPFRGAPAVATALASGFLETGAFLGCCGRSLDAGGRLSRGGSLFAAACFLVTIITSY